MISKYFKLQDFVPIEIYKQYGNDSSRFITLKLVLLCDYIQDYFKDEVTINDLYRGGQYNFSGFRQANCKIGAIDSGHKRGICADLKFRSITDYSYLRNIIKRDYDKFRQHGLTAIEEGTDGWLHVSTEWFLNQKELEIIPYYK